MKFKFRWTMLQLKETSTMRLLRGLIVERQSGLNPYTPLSQELDRLYKWVEKNIPDERVHDKA